MPLSKSHFHDAEKHDIRLRCPKDGQLMERSTIGGDAGVSIDRCAKCGCLWLDKGELERVVAMGAAKSADLGPFGRDKPGGPIAPMLCPRDASLLIEVADKVQKHVLIMFCGDCGGKLLDAGELLDLNEFTFAERLKSALHLGA